MLDTRYKEGLRSFTRAKQIDIIGENDAVTRGDERPYNPGASIRSE